VKFLQKQSLKNIARIINSDYVGTDEFPVFGMNEIHVVETGDIVFVDHPKYYEKALQSAATIILINKSVDCPKGKALLISDDPFRDFNKLANHFNSFKVSNSSISKTAQIGKETIIQPNVFIGNDVVIGDNCLIHANVTINNGAQIGNNVTIHSGTVIGGDAFYYKNRDQGFDKLVSTGIVLIQDDVEIGSNCTIDRGVSGKTTIGQGTKIDNLVQIGHDTVIGKRCLIASQVGIAGCVIIEDKVTLWGQVGVRSDIRIGKNAVVLGQTGVTKSIAGHKVYSGNPIQEARQQLKELATLKRLVKK
jgi:UDP-3-O-[3-hydroxymyristoyl] glucosamine N-acyltransferase